MLRIFDFLAGIDDHKPSCENRVALKDEKLIKEKARIKGLHQGAQLILSVFICLHLTGEPVSIGRIDHLLNEYAIPIDKDATTITISQETIKFFIQITNFF